MSFIEILILIAIFLFIVVPMFYKRTGKIHSALLTLIRGNAIEPAQFEETLSKRNALLQSPYIVKLIHQCIFSSRIDLLQCLEGRGIQLKGFDSNQETSLIAYAAGCEKYDEMSDFLISKGIDVAKIPENGMSGIVVAAVLKRPELIRKYASLGADISYVNEEGMTPLLIASQGADGGLIKEFSGEMYEHFKTIEKETIDTLLELGADIEITSPDGSTALHYAATAYTSASLESLLEHGANPNPKTGTMSPLALTLGSAGAGEILESESRDKALLLLKHGATIDEQDKAVKKLLPVVLFQDEAEKQLIKELNFEMLKMENDENIDDIFKGLLKDKMFEEMPNSQARELFDLIMPRIAMLLDDGRISIVDDMCSRGLSKKRAEKIFKSALAAYKMQITVHECRLQEFLFPEVKKLYSYLDTNDEIYNAIVEQIHDGAQRQDVLEALRKQLITKADIQALNLATPEEREKLLPDLGPANSIVELDEIKKRYAFNNLIVDAERSGIAKSEVLIRIWLRFEIGLDLVESFRKNFITSDRRSTLG